MDFRVLGPVEVYEGGRPLSLGGARERTLLALLLINAGTVVSTDRLADDLWDGAPPDNALSTLRVYVSRLRKALGGGDGLIRTAPPGYLFALDREDLDASRFERLSREAHADLTNGRVQEAAVGFRDALAMWRGGAYGDAADASFVQGEAARLEDLRLAAVEGRIEADLAIGRASALVGELEALTRQHPLRERLWGARMLALYRCGRQAEALRAYQDLRGLLAEVGIEPSHELAEIERAVLRQDESIASPAPVAVSSDVSTAPVAAVAPAPPGDASSVSSAGIITILFSDLVGSTHLLERVGEEAFELLRRTHFRLLREAVAVHAGTEVKNLGDGLMVVFSSAVDALECATAMQQAVQWHNRGAPEPLAVRVGVHVGEPMVDEADYFGTPVVVAKRLCDCAGGGQVLVSELVRALVGGRGHLTFKRLAPLDLKGLPEPMKVCELLWPSEETPPEQPLPDAVAGSIEGFVGRELELGQLHGAWTRATEGHTEVVFIAGEPGIGKTSLASRLAFEAHAAGALVLFGRCDEEALVPYQPLVEALTEYLRVWPDEELRARLGGTAGDLALLLPVLRARLPELAAPAGDETDRYRMFEAVPTLLAELTTHSPIVLLLDDLHWADRPTLQLLQHTIRRLPEVPLLILGTYRDTDLVRTHPMAETLADLRRAGFVERLALRGLSAVDVLGLVTTSEEPGREQRALADAVWQETEGSPLFLREILRHLEETDAIVRTDEGWEPRRRIDQLGIPEGVKEVIGRRLNRLSETTNTALRVGSVVGRAFDLDVLERVTGESMDTLLDVAEDACAAGIVAEEPEEPGRYAFTHALVRQALYGELSLTRRVRLHQRVGEALEQRYSARIENHLSELAFHFVSAAVAGNAEKAIDYARRAGERAMGIAAYEEAARHFEMALEVAEDAGLGADLRADLLLATGAARLMAGDETAARRAYGRAGDLAREQGDSERMARAALGFSGLGIRIIWISAGKTSEAIPLLEEALDALDESDSGLRARLLGCLAGELHYEPSARRRREELSQASVDMARRLGDPATLGYSLAMRALAVYGAHNLEERLAVADELLALARDLGDRKLEGFAYAHAGTGALEANDIPTWHRHLDAFDVNVERVKDPTDRALSLLARSVQDLLAGRFTEGEQRAVEAFQVSQEVHDPNGFPMYGVAMVPTLLFQGRLNEFSWAMIEGAIELYPSVANTLHSGGALVALARGDVTTAQALLDKVEPEDELAFPHNNLWLFSLGALAYAADQLGDRRRARQAYDALLPFADRNLSGGPWCLGPVSAFLGISAMTLENWDEAIAHFEACAARSEANGWTLLVCYSQVLWGAALVERGAHDDRTRAGEMLAAGLKVARDIGAGAIVDQAEAALDALAGRDVEHASPISPRRRDRARTAILQRGRRAVARLTRRDSDGDLLRRFGTPLAQRAMFAAVARAFEPTNACGFEGDIVHELRHPSDDTDVLPSDWWTLEVRGRKARARRGTSATPTTVIHIDLPDFVRLVSGELSPVIALVENRVEVDGDVLIAARLADMFGAVELATIAIEQS